MKMRTPAFSDEQPIPSRFTCDGENTRPAFFINEVPKNAKSLAFVMDDPDSPSGTWLHWSIWNIPPETTHLAEGVVPEGSVEGTTSFGNVEYGGPCPGSGTHRYFFTLYALDTMLDLPSGASRETLEHAMEGHTLDTATLMGTYQRQ